MSAQPMLSVPAWFSNAARAILVAKRPLWQYELLGQVLTDAVDQMAGIEVSGLAEPAEMVDAVTFDCFGNHCLQLVEQLATNLERMNPVIAQEVEVISEGGMHAFGEVAAKMGETFLLAKKLSKDVEKLPVRCVDMAHRSVWRRELEACMVRVRNDLRDLAVLSVQIHESIGDEILAKVRQTQRRIENEEPCVLDLNLRFPFDSDKFNDDLQGFIDCLDVMNRVLEAKVHISKAAINYGVPRPGRISLHQSLSDPDLVTVTVRPDGEGSAALTSPWKMLQSFVCIREVRVGDLRRAEACMRTLLDPFQGSSFPTTYQIPAAEASELIYRVEQLYPFPSTT